MKKPWWVFACDTYYPSGGMDDLRGRFANEEEALAFVVTLHYDFKDIVNVDELDALDEEE